MATQPHHRIVRIPPGECVVLNSAERAPYLLLVEILHDDLDFDATKRGNKEVLKRIVTHENRKKGASRGRTLPATQTKPSPGPDNVVMDVPRSECVLGKDSAAISEGGNEDLVAGDIPIPQSSSTSSLAQEEEMDLVEQVLGTGQSLREAIDLDESIVLPPLPKNRELELAAWSRTQSSPSTPEHSPGQDSLGGNEEILSLDDYSERMRTAAIMLAQLNANLVRETVTPVLGPSIHSYAGPPIEDVSLMASASSGTLNWLPRSSWLGVTSSPNQSPTGPLHPSLGGKQRPVDSPASTTRMRVNHAEAAIIRDRIMQEMLALEQERMARMREGEMELAEAGLNGLKTAEDEKIIKRELNKVDPSAVVFSESWAAKKVSGCLYFLVMLQDMICRVVYAMPRLMVTWVRISQACM